MNAVPLMPFHLMAPQLPPSGLISGRSNLLSFAGRLSSSGHQNWRYRSRQRDSGKGVARGSGGAAPRNPGVAKST